MGLIGIIRVTVDGVSFFGSNSPLIATTEYFSISILAMIPTVLTILITTQIDGFTRDHAKSQPIAVSSSDSDGIGIRRRNVGNGRDSTLL